MPTHIHRDRWIVGAPFVLSLSVVVLNIYRIHLQPGCVRHSETSSNLLLFNNNNIPQPYRDPFPHADNNVGTWWSACVGAIELALSAVSRVALPARVY